MRRYNDVDKFKEAVRNVLQDLSEQESVLLQWDHSKETVSVEEYSNFNSNRILLIRGERSSDLTLIKRIFNSRLLKDKIVFTQENEESAGGRESLCITGEEEIKKFEDFVRLYSKNSIQHTTDSIAKPKSISPAAPVITPFFLMNLYQDNDGDDLNSNGSSHSSDGKVPTCDGSNKPLLDRSSSCGKCVLL